MARGVNVYEPGSRVLILHDRSNLGSYTQKDGIKAVVSQVCVTANMRVTYEVAWLAGTDRKTAWVDDAELVADPDARGQKFLTIGFKETES